MSGRKGKGGSGQRRKAPRQPKRSKLKSSRYSIIIYNGGWGGGISTESRDLGLQYL